MNSASKNTSETDIFPRGKKSLLASVIEENRTQETVLNYCAQAKAMLKYVQKSKEKLH
jgi:hypothetical protein